MEMTGEALSNQEEGSSRCAGHHQGAHPQGLHQDPHRGRWHHAAEGGIGGDQDHLVLDRFFSLFLFNYLFFKLHTIDRKRYYILELVIPCKFPSAKLLVTDLEGSKN